ncbi:MAG: hypothetical protein ACI4D4_01935 [Lachnospira sp.]
MKTSIRFYAILLLLFTCINTFASTVNDTTAIRVKACYEADSLEISVTIIDSKLQLTALMQGLTVNVEEFNHKAVFPSAPMVRHKMKRHPNEVKASFKDKDNKEEIKPDLAPLIAALNDTVAFVADENDSTLMRPYKQFKIELDKQQSLVSFSIRIPCCQTEMISIVVSSSPDRLYDKQEFTGKRRSSEKNPDERGLGHASNLKNDKSRTFLIKQVVGISQQSI